jgi:AcrR family transcriptional regulator
MGSLTNTVRFEYRLSMSLRNPFEPRNVTSRRGGPVKKPLSREAIVTVALGLLTREGLEGMSLRKVATALETGPASLYAYVDDIRELQTLVLDRALADVEIPQSSELGWRVRLTSLLESYITVLARSPGLAQLAMNSIAAGPNALRIIEALLGLLDEAGVDQPTAAWAVDLLSLYVTAIASEQSHRREHGDSLGHFVRMLGGMSQQDFPRIHASREQLVAGEGLERFEWAIEVLLKGVLQTPLASPPGGSAPLTKKHSPTRAKRV